MKRIINILFLLMMLASCSDSFLDIPPQHYSNDATFFQTESHFTQAVNGIYEKTRAVAGVQGWVLGEMRSDNTHYLRNDADRGSQFTYREEIADFINDNQNTWSNEMYYVCYSGISRANTVLDRIQNKSFSDSFKNGIIGQAKFLRAFFYFQLVRTFGDVPLYTKEITGANDAFLPRSPVVEVYRFMLEDINDAITKLSKPTFPQRGDVTQGSAKMLLAKIVMTMPERDYTQAEKLLREIMEMGYDLEASYAAVFETSNKNNKESLFEIQYQQGDQGQQSDWLYSFVPRTSNAFTLTGVPDCSTLTLGGWNTPTSDLIDSYEKEDLRLNPSVAVAVGHNDANGYFAPEKVLSVHDEQVKSFPVYYYFINKYRHEHSKISNTDDNWPVYRYSDVLLLLAECLFEKDNGSAEALALVNRVRDRAGLQPLPSLTAEKIATERRHEFAFENQRWYDLVRTGKAVDVMNVYGEKTKKLYPYLPQRAYKVTVDKLIFPIPYHEMQINSQLVQNPGY